MKEGYKELIEAVVKQEKKIVKDVAITSVNRIEGVEVDEDGNVERLDREGDKVFRDIYKRYKEIGFGTARVIIKKAIKPVIEEYPELDIPEELK